MTTKDGNLKGKTELNKRRYKKDQAEQEGHLQSRPSQAWSILRN